MRIAKAFAPGNVSGVFKIIADADPAKMHSLGMGFTVAHGVTVTVAASKSTSVHFNGSPIEFATVRSVVAKLASVPLRVEIETDLPLSGGFGLSGASSLATAFAVNALLDLGRTEYALGMVAHVAEVENLTGLGDVAGQFTGGCLVKLVRGLEDGSEEVAACLFACFVLQAIDEYPIKPRFYPVPPPVNPESMLIWQCFISA